MDREKHMQKMPELPKRIEIETLPLSCAAGEKLAAKKNRHETDTKHHSEPGTKNRNETETKHQHVAETKRRHEPETKHHVEIDTKNHHRTEVKHRETEKKHHNSESESTDTSKPKSKAKKTTGNEEKEVKAKAKGFDLKTLNKKIEVKGKKQNTSKSLSTSSSDSPISTSLKTSLSSSTARINQKCYEAIKRAKKYFETRDTSKFTSTFTTNDSKANDSKKEEDDSKKQTKYKAYNVEVHRNADLAASKKEKGTLNKKGQSSIESQTPTKKSLKNQTNIDQKSINHKKVEKDSHSRNSVHVKTFPMVSSKENKNGSRSPSPTEQLEPKSEVMTPAKRYLRAKLGIEDKVPTNVKKETMKTSSIIQEIATLAKAKNGTTQGDSSKHGPKPQTPNGAKVRQPVSTRPVSNDTETNPKKLSTAHENQTKESRPVSRQSKPSSAKRKGRFSAKTDVITNIEPYFQETNKLSIELKRPIVLTKSKERLIAKALKIGLKKVNCPDLRDVQIKLDPSGQSFTEKDYLHKPKSDVLSMQTQLESKISAFQNEMERRQKHTFNKIQELEDTIQFRRQQLLDVNKTKTKPLHSYGGTRY